MNCSVSSRKKRNGSNAERVGREERRMNEIKAKITVDTQELEDATDLIEEVGERLNSVVPNITIRNNQNVYVTINNFNETESQWCEKNERN